MITSSATATWNGVLRSGNGEFEAGSGAFAGAYTFATRFEGKTSKKGTNPEELIASAHAACLSMALSAALEKAGTPPTSITTKASCTIAQVEGAFKITKMRLEVRGKVNGLDQAGFVTAAEGAKANCPVSKALSGNVEFELDAQLVA
jgi:osmotically inducible protein OsmC